MHQLRKMYKKYSLPWVNRRLKTRMKTKDRLHKRAKKSGKWDRYRKFQKECKHNLDKQNTNI